jgi:GrpB-like predicted nucleotidyltransferase (UPF0157 family)
MSQPKPIDISALERLGLGMPRERVVLAEHDARWTTAFEQVSGAIRAALPREPGLELHHIGSTSVPGLCAKPIVDILGSVAGLEGFDTCRSALESLGFEWKGEYGIPGRRYCVLYDEGKERGYVHLHVHDRGHADVRRNLLFRDYLRVNPDAAARYGELKAGLQREFESRREHYTDSKRSFIETSLLAADARRMSDDEFLAAFERGRIPKIEWNHAAHVRMAWLYLRRHGLEVSVPLVREGIRRFNAAMGGPPTAYHETVTVAYLRLVQARLSQAGCPTTWERFAAAHPELLDRREPLLLRHYSRELIESPRAREEFVEPDLRALSE